MRLNAPPPGPSTHPATALSFDIHPLVWTAERLVAQHRADLPKLAHITVLLEEPLATRAFRHACLNAARAQGCPGLLGPRVLTRDQWLDQVVPPAHVLNPHARALILYEAIQAHATLFPRQNLWHLCATLLTLFDELTLSEISPGKEQNAFVEKLKGLYGVLDPIPLPLSQEAILLFTLWQAWHEQLTAQGWQDGALSQVERLEASLNCVRPKEFIYLLGQSAASTAERHWVQGLIAQGVAELIVPINTQASGQWPETHLATLASTFLLTPVEHPTPSPAAKFLTAAFALGKAPLLERAAQYRLTQPHSPVGKHLRLVSAQDLEQEALVITQQIYRWHQHGVGQIGVVIEHRKLARRVRSLLERYDLNLNDIAGWTLSTTAAATVLEDWLECLETDFFYEPLLGVLQSPFTSLLTSPDEFLTALHRFETDLVHHERIAWGLDRYRHFLKLRSHRLGFTSTQYACLDHLLATLDTVSQTLLPLLHTQTRHPTPVFLKPLLDSLDKLGITAHWQADPAGKKLLDLLTHLEQAAACSPTLISWIEFRSWLGQALETTHFRPESPPSSIYLLSLAQTRLLYFDRLIIANNLAQHIPGKPEAHAYLNHAIRRQLGLSHWEAKSALCYDDYRRVIQNTLSAKESNATNTNELNEPRVVLTLCLFNGAEPLLPSPWFGAIRSWHQAVYGQSLEWPLEAQTLPYPQGQFLRPYFPDLVSTGYTQVVVPSHSLPTKLSATAHQQLIDCPYLFYCAEVLNLKANDEYREALTASEFGKKVHLCLEAFHTQVPGVLTPFPHQVTNLNRTQALKHLAAIITLVFSGEDEVDLEHHSRLVRAQAIAPLYVDWLIDRQKNFATQQSEKKLSRDLDSGLSVFGRIDRIDIDRQQHPYVVDYKTGALPTRRAVEQGEAVQLLTYALLVENSLQVEYLSLSGSEVASKVRLEEEVLGPLRDQAETRLQKMWVDMKNGMPLPAWGDHATCERCVMSGICRHQIRNKHPQKKATPC